MFEQFPLLPGNLLANSKADAAVNSMYAIVESAYAAGCNEWTTTHFTRDYDEIQRASLVAIQALPVTPSVSEMKLYPELYMAVFDVAYQQFRSGNTETLQVAIFKSILIGVIEAVNDLPDFKSSAELLPLARIYAHRVLSDNPTVSENIADAYGRLFVDGYTFGVALATVVRDEFFGGDDTLTQI